MAKEIKTDKLFVNKVFENWFRIPEYQRPYVWERDHVLELLEDVNTAMQDDSESEYFLGSIVFNIKENSKNNQKFQEYDLLDGQQRLTTLFLLIAVGRDLSEDEDLRKTCSEFMYQKENKFKGIPERLRIVFDIRDDVKEFINKYVKEDKGTLKDEELKELSNSKRIDKSIKNMANAILTIKEYYNINNINLGEFYEYLFTKVLMVYVASEDLDDAFKLFTVLNDRGVKLRSSDILKASNLKEVEESEREKYAKIWEDLENQFGDYFDNFLSHIRTILVKTKAKKNLLDEYEKLIYKNNLLSKGKNTFDFVKKYKEIYNLVLENSYFDKFNNYDIDNLLTVMKETFPSDIWVPPLLKYFEKFRYENIDVFIKKIERKASYEWIMQYTPTKRIENMNAIIKIIEDANNSDDVLNKDELNQVKTDKLKQTLQEEIYGRRFARYILYKLEYLRLGNTQKINIPKHISVEHILPQNPEENSQWVKDFSEEERKEWTDKLGNLVLISRIKNSSLSRLDFKDKQEKYFKKSIEVFPCVSKIMQNNEWDLDTLKQNQEEQLNLLMESYENE